MDRRSFIKNGGFILLGLSWPSVLFKNFDMESNSKKLYDTIIIGGSYAGLASAMTLGRSLRNVLIIDSGNPCNKQTPHSHNFLTRDGLPPGEIAEIAREEVSKYPTVEFHDGIAVQGSKIPEGFLINTSDGKSFQGKILIFATGLSDIMHEIKGFAECWGISVIHCPYCHGYEFRNKKTAILAEGDRLIYFTSLIKNLTDDVTLITSDKNTGNEESFATLQRNGVKIIEKKIVEIKHHNGYVDSIIFSDGTSESFEAVYAPVPFRQHCNIPEQLGCEITEKDLIRVDALQKTSVDGIYAAGDNSNALRAVSLSVSSGTVAGVGVNADLSSELFSK